MMAADEGRGHDERFRVHAGFARSVIKPGRTNFVNAEGFLGLAAMSLAS